MSVGIKKAVWWFVLAGGAAGGLLFMTLCLKWGLPPRNVFYVWPILAVTGSLLASYRLVRLYRQEPRVFSGRWQLTISDLMLASFVAGLLFTVWSAWSPRTFLLRGVIVCLLLSLIYLGGLLLAARTGYTRFPWRHLFALGCILRLGGYIGSALFLFVLLVVMLIQENVPRFLNDLLFESDPTWLWVFLPMRYGLVCLPLGLLLCWVARRGTRSTGPPSGPAPSNEHPSLPSQREEAPGP